MRTTLTSLVLIALIIINLGCHKETEQDKIRMVITTVQKAAEERAVKKVLDSLSKTYSDPQGYNFETIRALLAGYFFRNSRISVAIFDLEISVEDTVAKAVFQAVLTGSKTGSAADLIPESLGIYAFVVEMKKEPEGWKVTSATWERVGEGESKGGP